MKGQASPPLYLGAPVIILWLLMEGARWVGWQLLDLLRWLLRLASFRWLDDYARLRGSR